MFFYSQASEVDLDAGDVKTIKGFTWMPRQSGANGKAEKKVLFDKSAKARYIRFTALSEQRGQDFATGAEMTILAE